MPAESITIMAQWDIITTKSSESETSSDSEKPSEYVEIVFNKGDMSEDEAREAIGKYTDEDFTIERFEKEGGETRVIIKFEDKEKANEFVRNVNVNKRPDDALIKIVRSISGYGESFSFTIHPARSFPLLHIFLRLTTF